MPIRLRQAKLLLAAIALTFAVGTIGFHLVLTETWFQCFYRTAVTVTLAGLDTVPSNNAARALSIVLLLAGLTIIAYAGAVIVEAMTGGVLSGALAERRRRKTIDRMHDHYIICGYGRVGRRVAEEFRASGVRYVVLDFHEDAIAAANARDELLVEGDATEDEDLERAGLARARGLVAASDSDADNLYVTLSARAARPDLAIVARASDADAERKLKLAGADRVVLPYTAAGRMMANLVLKPEVTEFLDIVTTAAGPDLQLAEIEVHRAYAAAGRTIRELRIRHETGALVVALRKPDGSFDTTPEPDTPIEVGDVLIAVGSPDEIRLLEEMFAPGGPLSPDPVSALAAALAAAAGAELELERPAEAEHGDYATNVALQLAGGRRRAPREIAEEIAAAAAGVGAVERAEVAGPGFVNVFLRDEWFVSALEAMLAGEPVEKTGRRLQVEMVSANPTGPVTVASARNGAYGDAVARLLAASGNEVEREYYYNDAGAQMDKFRASVDAVRRGEEPPEDGYHGDYLRDLEGDDPVAAMRESIESSLERFRIHIDTWRRQSAIGEDVPAALASIETYEQDGAVWAPTTRFGDDKDRVVIRSDGTYTYFAADIAYVRDKLERGFDTAMYVLGADHHGYVARLRAAAGLLGYDPARVEVLLYQLVHLTKGGEATKMSKRSGDVVFLDELIDEVGVDAARWYLVNRGPDQAIEIDIDLAAERSQKNPVYYVQYAHARIAGILRNAPDNASNSLLLSGSLAPEEKELIKRLAELPGVIADAAAKRGPQGIPVYAIRVADDFHRFYHEHRVLESEQESFRLGLCRATQTVIARCLDLVGVDAPERM